MQGFCRGCGEKLARIGPGDVVAIASTKSAIEPFQRLQQDLTAFRIELPQPKSIWRALGLTLSFGPVGMLYSTVTGALVMTIVSLAAEYFLGNVSLLVTWPVCLAWAGYAAWKSGYIY